MPENDLIGGLVLIAYYVIVGLPMLLLKAFDKLSFEVARKMYHFAITLSIFPLLKAFSSWQSAVLAAILFIVIVYPILLLIENSGFYKRIAVERKTGEFKSSLIIAQLMIASLIFVFWGVLGVEWQYIAVVAIMAWGFGDAAAALVGKSFGRNRIRHPRIKGTKTVEGALAMFVVAGLAIFLTLLIYAGQPWYVSILIAVLVAPISAVIELFSNHGLDTVTVPITVAFSVLGLTSILSLVGVGV
ncbi:MAG TPA: hypothetical protein PKX07_09050 [Aggregatilineales bacterium]|mgnify:CR=1 FL=1|nr:hypothetical protein [Aggregatilineales bacterium]